MAEKKPEKPAPSIPICEVCKKPLTQCQCKHNDLIKSK